MLDEKALIPCKIIHTVKLSIGDPNVEFNSGCSVIEVSIPPSKRWKVGFIKFKNNYVASISVRLKFKDLEEGQTSWKTVLSNYVLMPSPHHELGGQDYFIIDAKKQFSSQPEIVTNVRLILRQPSPHWTSFSLEDLKFFLPPEESLQNKSRTDLAKEEIGHLAEEKSAADEDCSNQLAELGIDTADLTSKVKKLVSLATDKRVKNSLKKNSTGRFDVDGVYDLNLLSYT